MPLSVSRRSAEAREMCSGTPPNSVTGKRRVGATEVPPNKDVPPDALIPTTPGRVRCVFPRRLWLTCSGHWPPDWQKAPGWRCPANSLCGGTDWPGRLATTRSLRAFITPLISSDRWFCIHLTGLGARQTGAFVSGVKRWRHSLQSRGIDPTRSGDIGHREFKRCEMHVLGKMLIPV